MKRYSDDYEIVITEDEKGREKTTAMYRGNYFETVVNAQDLVKFKRNGLLLIAAIIGLHVGAGFIANPGMIQFYVSLPYVIAFLPLYFLAAGMLRVPNKKRKFRRDEVELSFDRVRSASIFLLVFLSMSIIGELVFLFWFAKAKFNFEYLYLAVEILALIAAYVLIRIQKPIIIRESTEQ